MTPAQHKYLRTVARRYGYASLDQFLLDAAMRRARALLAQAARKRNAKTGTGRAAPMPASSTPQESSVTPPKGPRVKPTAAPRRRQVRGTTTRSQEPAHDARTDHRARPQP